MPATAGYNEASKRAEQAAKVEADKRAAEEAAKRQILERQRTPGYVSSLDQNPKQALNQSFTARERREISAASDKVQAKADAKKADAEQFKTSQAEAKTRGERLTSQYSRINITTGEANIRQRFSPESRFQSKPTRRYTTEYESPYHNQQFGSKRVGDWLRMEQTKKDRELSKAKTIPEFGDILKRQTTKKTIDNESAKQFMKDYADMQLGNIRRSKERKGQADFGIAKPSKDGGIEQVMPSGEIFKFGFIKPKAENYHYFVEVGGPQKAVYGGPNQPFLEVPKETDPFTGFTNYFRNVAEFGASGAGFVREAKYQPEAESAAFSAIFGFGERAVRGVPLEANLPFTAKAFGDIGLAVQKNPGYFGGGIAASVLTTVFPYGKVATLGRVGVRAAKGSDIFANLTKGGKTVKEPFANFGKIVSKTRVQTKPYDVLQDLTPNTKNIPKAEEITTQSIVPKLFRDTGLIGSTPKGPRSFRSISSIFERTSPIEGGGRGQTTILRAITQQVTKQKKQSIDTRLADELKASLDTTPITTVIKPTGKIAKETKDIERAISQAAQTSQKEPIVPPLFGESKTEKAARLARVKALEKQTVPTISRESSRDGGISSYLKGGVLLGFRGATGAERKLKKSNWLDIQNDILRVPASTPDLLLGPRSKTVEKSFTKSFIGTTTINKSLLENLTSTRQRTRQSTRTDQITRSVLKLDTPQLFKQPRITRQSTYTNLLDIPTFRPPKLPKTPDIPTFRPPKRTRIDLPGFGKTKSKKRAKGERYDATFRSFMAGDIVGAFLGSESPITKKLYKEFGRAY